MAAAAALRAGAGRRRARHGPKASSSTAAIARITSFFLLVLSGAIIVCAVVGLVAVGWNDNRRASERHAALRLALDEVHAVFGRDDRFEEGTLRLIERRAGVKDLHFATEPPAGDREVQSLHDREGRITGWLTWQPDRALERITKALWVLVAIAGAALAGGAFVAAHAGRRLRGQLARSTETVRRLTEEDALTALPNHRATFKRLERRWRGLARGQSFLR